MRSYGPVSFLCFQIFEPSAYPKESVQLVFWGNKHLETLLQHYGASKKNAADKLFNPLVDPDSCRGEFLPFKRLVFQNLGESSTDDNDNETFHFFRPTELFEKLFSVGAGKDNRRIFKGKFWYFTLHLILISLVKNSQH